MSRSKALLAAAGTFFVGGTVSFLVLTSPPPLPSEQVPAPTAATQDDAPGAASPASAETVYRIVPSTAKAEFVIDEILRGEPFTVVGATDQVTGELFLNAEDFSKSRLGVIRVNARTLKTDSERRDGAIARAILKSTDPANEFIEFRAKSVSGLPTSAAAGETHEVKITGDLTVSGSTKEVTFDGTVGMDDAGGLTGSAQAVVLYKDFNLSIPKVPFVASVDDDLLLKISFAAVKQ